MGLIYLPAWILVDVYGFHVSKYIVRPMNPMTGHEVVTSLDPTFGPGNDSKKIHAFFVGKHFWRTANEMKVSSLKMKMEQFEGSKYSLNGIGPELWF